MFILTYSVYIYIYEIKKGQIEQRRTRTRMIIYQHIFFTKPYRKPRVREKK